MDDREHSVQYFLDLIKKSHRGKFKVYIGMIDRKSTRLNSSHNNQSRMPSSA